MAALLASVAAGACACGSSHPTGTSADPAGVIPASAPLYAGATVRPSGSLMSAALADGRALTGQANPYQHLLALLQTPGSPALDYKRDVAPWLGPRAGVFFSALGASSGAKVSQLMTLLEQTLLGGSPPASAFPFGAGGAQGAVVLDTSNLAAASSFLASQAKLASAHAATYRGVPYQLGSGGVAFAIVDRFAVIGSESAVHGVIDTTLGGASLTHAGSYATLLGAAPAASIAHLYADPAAFGAGAAQAATPAGAGAVGNATALVAQLAGRRPLDVSFLPGAGSITLDADSLGTGATSAPGGLLSSLASGASALGELPGESWLAAGLGEAHGRIGEDVQGIRSLLSLIVPEGGASSESFSVAGLLGGILKPLAVLGADTPQARRDFQSWMDSAAIFAGGNGLLELKAGVVIGSQDPARSRAAVSLLAQALRAQGGSVTPSTIPGTEAAVAARLSGLPIVLDIAAGRDAAGAAKFVMGLGESSVTAALSPSSTLAGGTSSQAAAAALGEAIQPSLIVDFPTLLGLLEAAGLSADPSVSKFVPVLHSLSTLYGGGKSAGASVQRLRLKLSLAQSG
jgi:hypothetical protein